MADTGTLEEVKMSLLEHLTELRQRLVRSFVALLVLFFVCYYFSDILYSFLAQPLADAFATTGGNRRMIYTALHEAFFTYIKVAFFAAFFLAFPFIGTEIWRFVAPGLYNHEKKAVLPLLVATPVLFFMGGAFAYYVVFPMAWKFFLGFEAAGGGIGGGMAIQLEAKVGEYLSLVMRLIFAFGLCSELPVIMLLLAHLGIATSKGMAEKRRYAVVAAFVAAAILTPPDVISQICLAIPTMLLYEVSIVAVRMTEKRKREEEGVEEDDIDDDDEDDDAEDVPGDDEETETTR